MTVFQVAALAGALAFIATSAVLAAEALQQLIEARAKASEEEEGADDFARSMRRWGGLRTCRRGN
ncbi:MAG: hypothetical protein DI533_04555 [Cereibacter sphaeroides]|uniref:Uncharacterized protein n=1 Tax=Cereibacter sphaeroides TaxID=1063 RepID=A0A2W5TV25_CERSP|nr:MAG: hypothetical protein DI533_04555 [Cereibacter sphaeroides]